jgi:hypothetical protein
MIECLLAPTEQHDLYSSKIRRIASPSTPFDFDVFAIVKTCDFFRRTCGKRSRGSDDAPLGEKDAFPLSSLFFLN